MRSVPSRVLVALGVYSLLPIAYSLLVPSAASADHDRPKPEPWAPQAVAERLASLPVPEGMVRVPAGWFLMGSDPAVDRDAGPQEQPQRRIFLDAFDIDRYEASNVEYLRYVLATGAEWPWYWREDPFPEPRASHPVIGVSWLEAEAYCQWAGKRLPTEAEWEKASRGVDGRIFPWGSQSPGWIRANIGHAGSKRGVRYPPLANVNRYDTGVSPYGVYQMAGNVAEWVADWFDPGYYRHGSSANPQGPDRGQDKVFRGGSWNEDPEVARSAGRGARPPDYRSYLVGFRCVRDAPRRQPESMAPAVAEVQP